MTHRYVDGRFSCHWKTWLSCDWKGQVQGEDIEGDDDGEYDVGDVEGGGKGSIAAGTVKRNRDQEEEQEEEEEEQETKKLKV